MVASLHTEPFFGSAMLCLSLMFIVILSHEMNLVYIAGQVCDGDLRNVALSKLEDEFKRLLADNCLPVPIPAKMGPQTEDAPFSSFELEYLFSFPSEVLQKLQVIVARLVGSVHYQTCLDAYQESRSEQCRQSLEVG